MGGEVGRLTAVSEADKEDGGFGCWMEEPPSLALKVLPQDGQRIVANSRCVAWNLSFELQKGQLTCFKVLIGTTYSHLG